MPLVTFDAVSAEYGAATIFTDLSFTLEPGQRLGVVGPNGAGKSTMMRILAGQLEPATGRVDRQRRIRLGMLDQFDVDFGPQSVLEQTISARSDLIELRHRLHALEQRMSAGEHDEAILHEYGEAQERYTHGDGYTLEARAREVLGGLGFLDEALEQPCSELSGGQRRRVQLAQLLLLDSDVFLLDEPTNHLDLASIEWLEDYLRAAPQAMVIVSHDRRLLDDVADSILELEAGKGYTYTGNYSKFLVLRAARRREQLRQFEVQQEHIAHQEAFIQRYKAGQRAREARGRQTRLDRMDRVDAPADDKAIKIQFGAPPSAVLALRTKGFVAGFQDDDGTPLPLVQVPPMEVESGERIAIVGANGSGKSTVLRTLLGSLEPLAGSIGYGARVQSSYYDQHLGDLPPERTLVEVLSAAQPLSEESARSHLARLLFRGDDVYKKVKQLSGGERSRLSLARLMLDKGNLLFLDEPTNHLDLPSQEVLQDALLEFPGTIIFVSHDRELIDSLATHTWWLEGGTIHAARGGYRDRPVEFAPPRAGGDLDAHTMVPPHQAHVEHAPNGVKRDPAKTRAEAAETRRERAAAQKKVAAIEKQLETAEARVQAIESRLADPEMYKFAMEAEILGKEHATLREKIARLYSDWETASAELEVVASA
ncbi:MAG: ABC-F family ATP-binding cassette domain-containing protein [Candidatus Dormibacteria bacterium]